MEMIKTPATVPALQMTLERKEDSEPKEQQPITKCLVVYTMNKIKQKLATFTNSVVENEGFDPTTTELIVITLEPIAPNFHAIAYDFWMNKQTKVRYFQASAIITNPVKHMLVPNHQKVPAEEVATLLKENYAKKLQLPLIRFHEDPIARMIGLVPGDVVRITRPSPTAGECIMYRVCVP
jgi:DNA-directed RNA polymerase subunit H (RpoH/RPB5)